MIYLSHLFRPVAILVLLAISIQCDAQYQVGFLNNYFFGRPLSARAEALGQSFVSVDGDASSMHFNPAGLGNMKGIELSSSYSTPFYILTQAHSLSVNLAAKIHPKIAIGIRLDQISLGIPGSISDSSGNVSQTSNQNYMNHKFSAAYSITETFHVGASINYFSYLPGFIDGSAAFLDLGIVKKIKLRHFKHNQSINIGTSITNTTASNVKFNYNGTDLEETLPIISTYGLTYYLNPEKSLGKLKLFQGMVTTEYQHLLNSDFHRKMSIGGEFTLLEILILRAGYFKEKIYDYGRSSNKSHVESLTYGIGLQLPLQQLTKIPMHVSIDYAQFSQPSYVVGRTWDDLKSVSARLSYDLF